MEPHAADVSCEVGSKQGIGGAQPRPSSSLCIELELPSIFVGQRHLRTNQRPMLGPAHLPPALPQRRSRFQ